METNESSTPTISELLAQATPQAAEQLQTIAETTTDKEARKAARRALYLLSQKGIVPSLSVDKSTDISTPSTPLSKSPLSKSPLSKSPLSKSPLSKSPSVGGGTRRAAQRQAIVYEGLRAYASAVDGAGNRLLFLVWPDPDGGYPTFLQALVNDEEGIKDIDTRRIARNELAERLQGFEAQLEAGIALAEIDADYGRYLLQEATERTQQARRRTPPGFRDLLAVVGAPARSYAEHPVWQHIDIDALRNDPDLNHTPEALFSHEWFQPWFLDVEEVKSYLIREFERHTSDSDSEHHSERHSENNSENNSENEKDSETASPQNISEYPTSATLETATEIVGSVLDADKVARYRRRLADSAEILLRRDRTEAARQALYHALSLESSEILADNPFAVALVQRTMQVALDIFNAHLAKQTQPQATR